MPGAGPRCPGDLEKPPWGATDRQAAPAQKKWRPGERLRLPIVGRPDHQGTPHVRESRVLAPVRPGMRAVNTRLTHCQHGQHSLVLNGAALEGRMIVTWRVLLVCSAYSSRLRLLLPTRKPAHLPVRSFLRRARSPEPAGCRRRTAATTSGPSRIDPCECEQDAYGRDNSTPYTYDSA